MRDAMLVGVIMGLQFWSSIYTGFFLVLCSVPFAACLVVLTGRYKSARRLALQSVAAAATFTVMALPYALPYAQASARVGARTMEDVRRYSATLDSFSSAPRINRLYGSTAITDPIWADEMNLFPGLAAVALAIVGMVRGRGLLRFACFAGLVFALDLTLGANGVFYPWLFNHVGVFRALRSPARADIFFVFWLAALSGYGAAFLFARLKSSNRKLLAGGLVILLLVGEYASRPELTPAPAESRVDAYLSQQPASVIVELPLVTNRAVWGSLDWLYMYLGRVHFQKMLNGYSGFAPPSYYEMRDVMQTFPDDRSIAFLRGRGVNYVVVRTGFFEEQEGAALLRDIQTRRELPPEIIWQSGPDGGEALFKLVE
jgi:hypothetical protein